MSDEEEIMEVNDSEGSDSDDSTNDEEEERWLNRTKELENQLSSNKYLYDVHVELTELYKKLGDLNSLREAYQRFHEYFPLTAKIWLEWIDIEIKLSVSDEEKGKVLKLYEEAVEDYLSVNLWQQYAEFALSATNFNETRSILEKALTCAGLHVSDGSLLWDFLREVEMSHLGLNPEGSDAWKQQVQRVADVFKRQLSVPLLGMENTHNEWQQWLQALPEGHEIDPKPLEWAYKKALQTLESYKPFEEKLLVEKDESELYKIYSEYIDAISDPSTKLCVYERAVAQLCLNPELWLNYCNYSLKLGEAALKVSYKAVRNCTWSEELWVIRLRILEHLGKSEKEMMDCFEQGIGSVIPQGVELWLTYLEYARRLGDKEKLEKLFQQAIEQTSQIDSSCKIMRFYARLLGGDGDLKKMRSTWAQILNTPFHKGNASSWLEYASLERLHGEPNQLRSLFKRALVASKEWPQYIAEEWLMYERECGTLDDMFKCLEKCRNITWVQPAQQNDEAAPLEEPKRNRKRRYDEEGRTDLHHIKNEVKKLRVEQPKKEEKIFRKKVQVSRDPKKTIFISNIHPKVDEDKLKGMFPNAVGIEIVYDRKGKSRCYAYVQFELEEEASHALARDREPLDGRPVFISECKPDRNERKATNFKFSDRMEETKLFIRGLPIRKTREEVMEIFKPHGAIEVRLVLHKSGQPKGLAYVEFPDAESARKAMEATDQMKIDEHTITVAISAPPPKKTVEDPVAPPTRHARSRLQIPMIPRSLQVKAAEKSVESNGTPSGASAPKSNDDFRKMLLK